MMHDNDLLDAERLDAVWDAVVGRRENDEADYAALTPMLRRICTELDTPDPEPAFLADLRQRLVPSNPVGRAAASSLSLVTTPDARMTRPAFGRFVAVAVAIVVLVSAALVGWPSDDGDVPLVASALASSEADRIVVVPTATVWLPGARLRTVGESISLWEAPAVGTPTAALAPSTPVELLDETVGRQGERWLRVRADDGSIGWVRACDVTAGGR